MFFFRNCLLKLIHMTILYSKNIKGSFHNLRSNCTNFKLYKVDRNKFIFFKIIKQSQCFFIYSIVIYYLVHFFILSSSLRTTQMFTSNYFGWFFFCCDTIFQTEVIKNHWRINMVWKRSLLQCNLNAKTVWQWCRIYIR